MHRWLVPGADCRQYPLLFAIGITFFGAGVGTLVYALRTGDSAVRLAALRATRRSLRHGVSRFEMARVPGVVGERLEGRLHARLERAPDEGVRLVLTCVRRTMAGSGRHRAAHEAIAWQEEATVPPAAVGPGTLGVAVPVSLTVPYG